MKKKSWEASKNREAHLRLLVLCIDLRWVDMLLLKRGSNIYIYI